MIKTLQSKIYQKKQYIEDIEKANINEHFRGMPLIDNKKCNNCGKCIQKCPTGAININPISIDIGKCTFCGACQYLCTKEGIKFSNYYKLGSTSREKLIINEETQEYEELAIQSREEIKRVFRHSLKLRQVSAGGCNGCEMELNACSNVNFDMGRFGIDFVASPKHADGIVITGAISENMTYSLEHCYESVPNPKIIILAGTCAISGGVFQNAKNINREFIEKNKVDLYIPGCPIHPLTFINAILKFIK